MMNFMWNIAIAVIWGISAMVLAGELSIVVGVLAAFLGSVAAVIGARKVAVSALRLPVIWAGCLASLMIALVGAHWLTSGSLASAFLGPATAFSLGEIARWFAGALLIVLALRASSIRYRAWLGLELAVMAAVLAGAFAAHRGGFINRPYSLVDGLWAKGYDPVPVFIAFGLLIASALLLLVFHRGSSRHSPWNLGLLLLLIALVFVAFPIGKLKEIEIQQSGASGSASGKGNGPGGGTKPKENGKSKGQEGSSGGTGSEKSMESLDNIPSSDSNPPVAVVIFRQDYTSPLGYYYFRQTAFSQFNGLRFVQDTSGAADRDILDSFPAQKTSIPSAAPMLPESMGRPSYFEFLDTTVAMIASHSRPFFMVNAMSATPRNNPDPNRFVRAYDARSAVISKKLSDLTKCRLGSAAWEPALWKHYTEGSSDPRYAELADRILRILKPEFQDLPIARALAVKMWLDKNGIYSLQSSHEKSSDPLADFLFGDRTGHCVYFAHSACMLLRVLGIPARVGAGYAVDGRDRGEGSALMIRAKNAHAWPEIHLDGIGWIPFDISPAKSLEPPVEAPDQGLQQMLGEMVREGAGNPRDEHKTAAHGNLQEAVRRFLKSFVATLPYVLAALLALLYIAKVYRRLAPFFCRLESLPRLAYRASLDCLADAGYWRNHGQTREAFAGSLMPRCPSFLRLTEIHLDRALGQGHAGVQLPKGRQLCRSAAQEINNLIPWWRRWLGAVHPFLWLKVK
jgi:transglutaminase-like putative cysteine protease